MRLSLIAFFLSFSVISSSQVIVEAGVLPSININGALNNKFKLNLKVENRLNFYSNLIAPDVYELSDATLIGTYKLNSHASLGAGYLIRYESLGLSHRTIQQFNYILHFPVKIGHRIAMDQTFSSHESNIYRLRYRIGSEIPLSGKTLNRNEFYLKISNEYLGLLQDNFIDINFRISPFIGYSFAGHNKLELGLDQRFEDLRQQFLKTTSWITLNWYYSF